MSGTYNSFGRNCAAVFATLLIPLLFPDGTMNRQMKIDHDLLESTARRMQRCRSTKTVIQLMASQTPGIYQQLEKIRDVPLVLSFWATSHNFDENAKQTIVHPRILQAIGELTNCPLDASKCHAGLLHTYGYLFSVIDTPYGKKRDRWLKPRIARGFKLPMSLLGPHPAHGTLLFNLTYFIGSIAYQTDSSMLRKLQRLRPHVASEIANYDYASLSGRRIIESVKVESPRRRTVELVTDLIPFAPFRRDQKHLPRLLVYSSKDGVGNRLLNTMFEMKPRHAEALLQPDELDSVLHIRARYNTVIAGFTKPKRGSREYVS